VADLTSQYQNQFKWRDWPRVFDAFPDFTGKRILDLGCAQGDLSEIFVSKGASVTGVDMDEDLLSAARAKNISRAQFINARLDQMTALEPQSFDIIWVSFTVAYFVDQKAIFSYWKKFLKKGGLIIVTEMSHLLGQRKAYNLHASAIEEFYKEAFDKKRYDFKAGDKIKNSLIAAGFSVQNILNLCDQELSPRGRACDEVIQAWRERFDRMPVLQKSLGQGFVRDFISGLAEEEHKTDCSVICVFASNSH
jgi:2-polyprenyl-6-hydroxyphenyl methylase/3-demethylubiquinone-9 3-methyltransferase